MSTLTKAIAIAAQAHIGQIDKAGKEYIYHPLRVMTRGNTEEEKIVGILHDVVEDSDWTFDQLEQEGFSKEIVEALRCVTKTSEVEDYEAFIQRAKQNPIARQVKLNDLLDNMDITRLEVLKEKDVKRLNKYLKAYRKLVNKKGKSN
jgi:(p)ppGpp synthase/HD superfamily hydrolase